MSIFARRCCVASDGSAQALLDQITKDGSGKKAPELGPLMAEQWTPALANVGARFDLRLVQDLLTPPAGRPGLVFASVAGRQMGNFDVSYDPREQNQITAGRQTGSEKSFAYEGLDQLPRAEFSNSSGRAAREALDASLFSEQRFRIDASLDAELHLKATVHASRSRPGPRSLRAISFEVANAMEVSAAAGGRAAGRDLEGDDGCRRAADPSNGCTEWHRCWVVPKRRSWRQRARMKWNSKSRAR